MFAAPLDRFLEIQLGNIGDTDGGLFLSLGQARVGGGLPLRNNPGAVVIFLWPPSHVDTPKWGELAGKDGSSLKIFDPHVLAANRLQAYQQEGSREGAATDLVGD
jgi:hypothetical protein